MLRVLILWLFAFGSLAAEQPSWIWGKTPVSDEIRHFRRSFQIGSKIRSATLIVACDNQVVVSLNGQPVGKNDSWSEPSTWRVGQQLKPGDNLISVVARNEDGAAGLLVRLEINGSDGRQQVILSDAAWETSQDGTTGWIAATELGKHGIQPWGTVLKGKEATPASRLTTLPGFVVELIHSAQPGEGSWAAMTFDGKGRIILAPQGGEPPLRVHLDAGKVGKIDSLEVPARGAMGLLWAFDSLYVNGRGSNGLAIYRLHSSRGDDRFDTVSVVRKWTGDGGEHGPHGMVAGRDGKIYAVSGNFVDVPPDLSPKSPVRNYADDLVLPRLEDGNGFGKGRKPPGGFVLRMNPDGTEPELFAAGQRNVYDIAFNDDGELFAFDSDMEWDWGQPWYRPIRILHCFQGADHGFREGSGKWPATFADSVPPVVEVGIGSPTGVTTGRGARFPARYQKALFAMDWSYGRILAVHLKPNGASYTGGFETLLRGKPLNVTDLAVGPDGALYFTTGGRGTQSGLYRVTYNGTESTAPVGAEIVGPESKARESRRQLERWQRETSPEAIASIWPALGSSDRTMRFSARVALERQPVENWRQKALAETNATTGLEALLALARVGTAADQPALLKGLGKWPLDTLDEEHFLAKLRVIEVAMARHGIPGGELRSLALQKLGRQFPAKTWAVNRQLSSLLVALDSPDVVVRALDLRDAAGTQAEAIHYQAVLRKARAGWTPELRRRYFAWFHRRPAPVHSAEFTAWFSDVNLKPSSGASFEGFMKAIRQEAVAGLSDSEKGELAPWITGAAVAANPAIPLVQAKPRPFVKHWSMGELERRLGGNGRAEANGKKVYAEAQCAVCHRLGGEGGAVGPDLTGLGAKYSEVDLLRSLLEPSAVVSEQYQAALFTLKDGETVAGRVLQESAERIVVLVDPLTASQRTIAVGDLKSRGVSRVSPMPDGLLDTFGADDVLDLVAFLKSSGR